MYQTLYYENYDRLMIIYDSDANCSFFGEPKAIDTKHAPILTLGSPKLQTAKASIQCRQTFCSYWHRGSEKCYQCWLVVIWILESKSQWNFMQNTRFRVQVSEFENKVRKVAVILSRPWCVKSTSNVLLGVLDYMIDWGVCPVNPSACQNILYVEVYGDSKAPLGRNNLLTTKGENIRPSIHSKVTRNPTQIARFVEPTWDPPGADRTQVGPMLAQWTLLSG